MTTSEHDEHNFAGWIDCLARQQAEQRRVRRAAPEMADALRGIADDLDALLRSPRVNNVPELVWGTFVGHRDRIRTLLARIDG